MPETKNANPSTPKGRRASKPSSKLVQMRLRRRTLDRLDELHEMTGIDNRTQIVTSSIQLAHFISEIQRSGGRVIVEHENGDREALRILGL